MSEPKFQADKGEVKIGFTAFHWPKTLQSPPFWTPERRRHYIDLYGGEDSPGYRRNILGEDGDPENSVFPWHHFSKCLKDIPDYHVVKILVDEGLGQVSLLTSRFHVMRDGQKRDGREEIIEDRTIAKHKFDMADVLHSAFTSVPGLLFMGGDLGFSSDPTELVVRLVLGKAWRTVARLQLKGVSYDLQCEAIDIMDSIFSPKGIGLDFGAAGSAVVHILHAPDRYDGKNYRERVTGFQFGEAYDDMDENGETLIDKKSDKPRRKLAKELAIDINVKKMQRQEWELPFDKDYINYFPSYTYREGPRHRVFKKEDDHLIDAESVCTLKMIVPDMMREDLFATGT